MLTPVIGLQWHALNGTGWLAGCRAIVWEWYIRCFPVLRNKVIANDKRPYAGEREALGKLTGQLPGLCVFMMFMFYGVPSLRFGGTASLPGSRGADV